MVLKSIQKRPPQGFWYERDLTPNWKFFITSFSIKTTPDINAIFSTFTEQLKQIGAHGQILDATKIATWIHPFYATYQAFQSNSSKTMIAKNLNVEILLHIAGERQINRALKLLGLNDHTQQIAMILVLPKGKHNQKESLLSSILEIAQGKIDLDLLHPTPEKLQNLQKVYHIPNELFQNQPDWASQETQERLILALVNRGAILELEKVIETN